MATQGAAGRAAAQLGACGGRGLGDGLLGMQSGRRPRVAVDERQGSTLLEAIVPMT